MLLTELTISQARSLIISKEISPVELTRAHLERIEALDDKINAFITVTPELALQQAQGAERKLARVDSISDKSLGALFGIPIALKDLSLLLRS